MEIRANDSETINENLLYQYKSVKTKICCVATAETDKSLGRAAKRRTLGKEPQSSTRSILGELL